MKLVVRRLLIGLACRDVSSLFLCLAVSRHRIERP